MKKWFKSLSRQEKIMALLILLLLVGVILRWDNVREKAGIWFRADKIMEQRADTLPSATLKTPMQDAHQDSVQTDGRENKK